MTYEVRLLGDEERQYLQGPHGGVMANVEHFSGQIVCGVQLLGDEERRYSETTLDTQA